MSKKPLNSRIKWLFFVQSAQTCKFLRISAFNTIWPWSASSGTVEGRVPVWAILKTLTWQYSQHYGIIGASTMLAGAKIHGEKFKQTKAPWGHDSSGAFWIRLDMNRSRWRVLTVFLYYYNSGLVQGHLCIVGGSTGLLFLNLLKTGISSYQSRTAVAWDVRAFRILQSILLGWTSRFRIEVASRH